MQCRVGDPTPENFNLEKRLRLVLCGKNDTAVECLGFLLENGVDVFVLGCAGDDGQDGWQRSLRGAACDHGVAFAQPEDINTRDVIDRLNHFEPEMLISIQYDQILQKRFFDGATFPCLNLHFSLLPRHRGVSPIAWALLDGDTHTGATLHQMVPSIDAGDIVDRERVSIAEDDTARMVYDKVSAAGVRLFQRRFPFSDHSSNQPQAEASASYHRNGDLDFTKVEIDWNRPVAELHRWIRAMIFPPFQWPTLTWAGKCYLIGRIDGIIGDPPGLAPGTVCRVEQGRLEVAAEGGTISIRQLADGEFAGTTSWGMRPGERLDRINND